MKKKKLINWLKQQIKIAESSAEELIQEHNNESDADREYGKAVAFQEVIDYLEWQKAISPKNVTIGGLKVFEVGNFIGKGAIMQSTVPPTMDGEITHVYFKPVDSDVIGCSFDSGRVTDFIKNV